MVKQLAFRIAKATTRRIIWRINIYLNFIGLSLIILDVENVRGLTLSRKTKVSQIELLLNKLRPVKNGWQLVRIGKSRDGSYLIPDDLNDIYKCMSAGCDKNWTFEKFLYSSYSIPSCILDSEDKRPLDLDPKHDYLAKWLGTKNGIGHITFESWIGMYSGQSDSDLILQMDIEGFEWQALANLSSDVLQKFRIMSIEFHGIQNLYNRNLFLNLYAPALEKILESFDVVHIHPNNCCGVHKFGTLEFPNIFEVTFHRRDRANGYHGYSDLPNNLDVKNVPTNPEIFIKWTE